MADSEEVLMVKPLNKAEEELAFRIQHLLEQIGGLRWNVMSVGVGIFVVLALAAIITDALLGWGAYKALLTVLGDPDPLLIALGIAAIAAGAGAGLAWVFWGKPKRRALEAKLAQLAADPRAPQVFEKLAQIYAVYLRLTHQLRASNEFFQFQPHPAIARYVRQYLGPLTQKT